MRVLYHSTRMQFVVQNGQEITTGRSHGHSLPFARWLSVLGVPFIGNIKHASA